VEDADEDDAEDLERDKDEQPELYILAPLLKECAPAFGRGGEAGVAQGWTS